MRTSLFALALLVPGCVGNFDPLLYMRDGGVDGGPGLDAPVDTGTDAGTDTGTDAGTDAPAGDAPDAPSATGFSDLCTSLVPLAVPTGVTIVPIDTTTLVDDFTTNMCVGDTPGNDAFAQIVAGPNERWHFHVRNSAGSDVALFLLTDCEDRTCEASRTTNTCGTSANEHLSIVAPPTGGTFILGVDSITPGGFTGMVEIYRPVCGNGMEPTFTPEHSENCDDGNMRDGDGCDSQCRTEISLATGTPTDVEVNDDYFAANHLLDIDGGTLLGTLRSGCDVDVFAVELTAGVRVRAEVTGRSMPGCPSGAPELDLRLLAPNGTLTLTSAELACPSIEFTPTTTGTHFVRIARPGSTVAFDYDLHFSFL